MSSVTATSASQSPVSINVEDLTVVYNNGNIAVENASFTLEPGKITALVGINGSGKSTIFKSLMGFVRPTSGSVRIGGIPVRQAIKQSLVAYVPQTEEVDWTFPVSVWDVAMMGRYGFMNFMRIPREIDKQIAMQSLERVNMARFKDRQIGELSGGQKKRVFLSRALAQQARVILLDEPFTGIDLKTEEAITLLLGELRSSGHTILVSTHNLGSVPEFCDNAVIINRTVLASGPIEEAFTEDNLSRAFGGKLRHFRLNESTIQTHDGRSITVMTDDERPLVFGKGGHLEFTKREGREEVIQKRAEGEEDK